MISVTIMLKLWAIKKHKKVFAVPAKEVFKIGLQPDTGKGQCNQSP